MRIILFVLFLFITACDKPQLTESQLSSYQENYKNHVRYRVHTLGDEKFETAFKLNGIYQDQDTIIFKVADTSDELPFSDAIKSLKKNSQSPDKSFANLSSGILESIIERHCPDNFTADNVASIKYNFAIEFNDDPASRIICQTTKGMFNF